MFTGLVEAVGTVTDVVEGEGVRRVTIAASEVAGLERGDSIAVDGVCLTAVEVRDGGFSVDVVGSTLARTTLGRYRYGTRVNLERPIRMGDRLDGHLVQGHVDAVGTLESVREDGEYRLLDFRIPTDVGAVTILHGSIAISGVALTVNALTPGSCQVAIIPHTWEHTNLRDLRPGDPVNLEGDMIGKYLGRMVAAWSRAAGDDTPRS
jgi:riboflavin synthase